MQYPLEYELAHRYARLDNRVMENENIAARLDEAMRARGLKTQLSLAKISGIPQPTIARILKGAGKQGPETETLRPLARALSVHLRWLQEGLGPRDLSSEPGETLVGYAPDAQVEAAAQEAANAISIRYVEMIETYRLASPTDRERIDLVIGQVRAGLGNKTKARTS